MKIFFYILTLFITPLVYCEVNPSTGSEDGFECHPSEKIKDRVNESCIQASDIAIDYKKPFEVELKHENKKVGKAFIISETLEDGSVRLKIAHQCTGKEKTSWTTMTFCGFQKSHLDRVTPGTKEIRNEIARANKLNEKTNQHAIDELMAKEINPWIADPKENTIVVNGTLIIKSLQKTDGTTCYESKDLTYKTNCQ